jgi:hypothetical protein
LALALGVGLRANCGSYCGLVGLCRSPSWGSLLVVWCHFRLIRFDFLPKKKKKKREGERKTAYDDGDGKPEFGFWGFVWEYRVNEKAGEL